MTKSVDYACEEGIAQTWPLALLAYFFVANRISLQPRPSPHTRIPTID